MHKSIQVVFLEVLNDAKDPIGASTSKLYLKILKKKIMVSLFFANSFIMQILCQIFARIIWTVEAGVGVNWSCIFLLLAAQVWCVVIVKINLFRVPSSPLRAYDPKPHK